MQKQHRKTLDYVNFLYAFGIILVVLGHSLAPQWHDLSHPWQNSISRWIYSFHMPLFFFLSGYIFMHTKSCTTFTTFAKKRASRLLVPYLFLNIAYAVPKLTLAGLAINHVPASPLEMISFLWFPTASYDIILWFVYALFMINILMFRFSPGKSGTETFIVTCVVACMSFFNPFETDTIFALNRVFDSAIYYWLGMFCYSWKDSIKRKITCAPLWLLSLGGAHLSCILLSSPPQLTAVCGIAASFILSLCIPRAIVKKTWMRPLYMYSYQIYLLSGFGHALVRVLFVQELHLGVAFCTAGIFLGGLLLPLAAVRIIQGTAPDAGVLIGMRKTH